MKRTSIGAWPKWWRSNPELAMAAGWAIVFGLLSLAARATNLV
jgi:hypothetical protein